MMHLCCLMFSRRRSTDCFFGVTLECKACVLVSSCACLSLLESTGEEPVASRANGTAPFSLLCGDRTATPESCGLVNAGVSGAPVGGGRHTLPGLSSMSASSTRD